MASGVATLSLRILLLLDNKSPNLTSKTAMHLEHYVDLMRLQNLRIGIQGGFDCFSAINHLLVPAGALISGFGAKVDIDTGAHF